MVTILHGGNLKQFYRIMLGRKSIYSEECHKGNFIGTDFAITQDLTKHLPDDWKIFNKAFIPIYLNARPEKNKISAGLACGALWTVSKGIQNGDIVLCPNGDGAYYVGEVISTYNYAPKANLPHQRKVRWFPKNIERSEMSEALRHSTGSIGTVSNVTKFSKEIESLLGGVAPSKLISTDETVQDPSEFALEEHLEDFLVKNWAQTELGKKYDIFEEDGELVGQQYPTDTGPIDILAISKDKSELLIVELKKGRASDSVVGQIQRYMGFVIEELSEENQKVRGLIIAHGDDQRIKRALSVTQNIDFYHYHVIFKLFKG
jgi:restriction system protein